MSTSSTSKTQDKPHLNKKGEFVVKTTDTSNKEIEVRVRLNVTSLPTCSRAFVGKLIVLGDSGVGKSQFIHALQAPFDETLVSIGYLDSLPETVGIAFAVVNCEIGKDTYFRAQIWDTAGQERFRSVLPTYARGVAGVILMYDVTNKESLKNVAEQWIPFLDQHLSDHNVPIILVGNKIDLDNLRQISVKEGKEFARTYRCFFAETTVLFRATTQTVLAEMCAHMHYSALRNKTQREIVVNPSILNTSIPTNGLLVKRTGKGRCCGAVSQKDEMII